MADWARGQRVGATTAATGYRRPVMARWQEQIAASHGTICLTKSVE